MLVAPWTLLPGGVSMRYSDKRLSSSALTECLLSLVTPDVPEPKLCCLAV